MARNGIRGLLLASTLVCAAIPLIALGQESPQPSGSAVSTPFLGGTYRALIIGNNDYRDPQGLWTPLKTAVHDAEGIADALREDYGFGDVTVLRNATRAEVIRAFNKLAEGTQPDDSVLVYYAGHGYLRESTREGFWIPVDAVGRDDSTFVPNVVIKAKLEVLAARARHVLLVSDSCFSGALLREGGRGIRLEDKTPGYFQSVAGKKSVQVLAAGGLEFVDDDYRDSGHSPFTYFFLNELRFHPGGMLDATDLSQAVARNVADNVAQTPERGILYGAGHEGGEFLLVKPEPPPPAPQPKAMVPVAPIVAASTLAAPLAGAAAGPGALYYSSLGLGGALGLYALVEYQKALSLTKDAQASSDEAQQTSDRSLYEQSLEQEQQAQDASKTATIAAAVSALSIGLGLWVFDEPADSVSSLPAWRVLPALTHPGNRPGAAVQVLARW